jgi:hypothetical protein
MERITARSEGDFFTVLYGSLWIAALSAIWFFCRADPEAPVKYAVEPPEEAKPGWKGEVLEKPTLKVLVLCKYITVLQLTSSRSQDHLTPQQQEKRLGAPTPPQQMASTAQWRKQKLRR